MSNKLTIGMVAYDDYDGIYFTIQSLRLHHPEIMNDVEFVIIDNNPGSAQGKAVKNLTNWIKQPVQYVPFDEYKSTAVRDFIFWKAKTDYVLCTDCHVLFEPGSIRKLIDFFREGKDEGNLLHGPLVYDDLINVSTHFDPVWRDRMWGIWATDARGKDKNAEPFEIPMQGLGSFACRKYAWPGFNPHFRGFGGEEGYIHEKFRRAGKKTLCLPSFRWLHRFGRPAGVPYPLVQQDRIINYFIGHLELDMDCKPIFEHFGQYHKAEDLLKMHDFAKKSLNL
jgi:hypothetical protein